MLAEKEVAAHVSSAPNDPIFIAIEMSRSKWVVGAHLPASDKIGIHVLPWGDVAALHTLIDRLRSRAAGMLGTADVQILCCYEAGYEGFWLHRRLTAAGLRVLVIDPSSLLVNRRARRAKTDRLDAKAMIRALMAYNRGEDQVLRAVHVPSVEQEDERRLMRERQRLVQERTAHSNRIRGLLMTQGIVGFDARGRGAERRLEELVTGDGHPLGPRLREEIRREIVRVRLVIEQLKVVDAERDAIVLAKRSDAAAIDTDEAKAADAMIAALTRIKGGRLQRRVGARARSLLAQVQQPARGRGMERVRAHALGERDDQQGPGDRQIGSGGLPLSPAADRLALAQVAAA